MSYRFVLVALLAVSTAQADTIYVDVDCPGPGDGSEADPYCSIQTAIDNAVDTDEIVVAPGTYEETINFLGKAITLRSSDGADVTTIDGTGNFHVVQCVSGEGSDTVLDGFTVSGGNAKGTFPNNSGGGMFNSNGSPTVINCTFSENSADLGGGMYNFVASPTVTGCVFEWNTAGQDGGGMYNDGAKPTISGSTFINNQAGLSGGGMLNQDSAPTVTFCEFIHNAAGGGPGDGFIGGGGMKNIGAAPLVTNCMFAENSLSMQSFTTSGGGIFNFESDAVIVNCEFVGNSAITGGGIRNSWNNATVMDCVFVENIALCCGGGIFNFGDLSTSINCLFVRNDEGGIHTAASDSVFINCTITENMSRGGMTNFNSSTPIILNSILWANSPHEISDEPDSAATVTYCDVGGGWPGIGNIDADPLFVDPDNGDYRLQAGSPCIDAGDNNAVPGDITTDLDGNPRFVDDPDTPDSGNGDPPVVDMGAYEFQGLPCPWDLDGDGNVFVTDLLLLLGDFGSCDGSPADFDGDGCVTVMDLLTLLGNWGPCPGSPCVWDVNGDGTVDQTDLRLVLGNFGPCDGCPEDVNGDGVVNGQDAAEVATHFGPCP